MPTVPLVAEDLHPDDREGVPLLPDGRLDLTRPEALRGVLRSITRRVGADPDHGGRWTRGPLGWLLVARPLRSYYDRIHSITSATGTAAFLIVPGVGRGTSATEAAALTLRHLVDADEGPRDRIVSTNA
jgi:hypothetical protein